MKCCSWRITLLFIKYSIVNLFKKSTFLFDIFHIFLYDTWVWYNLSTRYYFNWRESVSLAVGRGRQTTPRRGWSMTHPYSHPFSIGSVLFKPGDSRPSGCPKSLSSGHWRIKEEMGIIIIRYDELAWFRCQFKYHTHPMLSKLRKSNYQPPTESINYKVANLLPNLSLISLNPQIYIYLQLEK